MSFEEETANQDLGSASREENSRNVEVSRDLSPLWMVTRHPVLNGVVERLVSLRADLERAPSQEHELLLSRANLALVRASFSEMVRHGEQKLHKLCELFCKTYFSGVQLQSVVIGEVPSTRERFTLMQQITAQDLYSTTDLDLGNRQLRKLRYFDGTSWVGPHLVANVVEYQPLEPNVFGLHKIVSRIKAEEEFWNKVVDEIFDLDSLVRRDKKLQHLSRFVKDVFGIKIIVGSGPEVQRFQMTLESLRFSEDVLKEYGVPHGSGTEKLEFLEIKDYLGSIERKRSGWEAIKSVVSWWEKIFEIQIQPLGKFMREREFLTKESHEGFKTLREKLRDQVAEQVPLFKFYRDLLKWVFDREGSAPPRYPGVKLVIRE